MPNGITTKELRKLLRHHGELTLSDELVEQLANGGVEDENDLWWLYGCAMEPGNSEATFYGDPPRLKFSNAGTCTLGIVCEVVFANTVIPQAVLAKYANGEFVWPEDLNGVVPSKVVITYDEFYDESEDEDEEDKEDEE